MLEMVSYEQHILYLKPLYWLSQRWNLKVFLFPFCFIWKLLKKEEKVKEKKHLLFESRVGYFFKKPLAPQPSNSTPSVNISALILLTSKGAL